MKKILETIKHKWPEYLLEIIVIIIGILGAFALNNWKEQRQAMNLEIAALIELKEEFEQNTEKLGMSIERKNVGLRATTLVLDMIKKGNVDTVNIPMSTGLFTHNPSFGVLDKLLSTGKIDYIKNDSLRLLLSKWKEQMRNYTENEEWHVNFVFEHVRPLRDRLMPVPSSSSDKPEFQQWNYYDTATRKQFIKEAFSNLEFQNSQIRNFQRLKNMLTTANGLMNSLNRIIILLDSEISQKGE